MLLAVLKEKNIEFIVAPYEADVQLIALLKSNSVAAVISEDSDLVTYVEFHLLRGETLT